MLFIILAIIIYLIIGILISIFLISNVIEIRSAKDPDPSFVGTMAIVLIIFWPAITLAILLSSLSSFIAKALGSMIINTNERIVKYRERKKESEK